jgi:hypothetical protein
MRPLWTPAELVGDRILNEGRPVLGQLGNDQRTSVGLDVDGLTDNLPTEDDDYDGQTKENNYETLN